MVSALLGKVQIYANQPDQVLFTNILTLTCQGSSQSILSRLFLISELFWSAFSHIRSRINSNTDTLYAVVSIVLFLLFSISFCENTVVSKFVFVILHQCLYSALQSSFRLISHLCNNISPANRNLWVQRKY